MKAMSSAPALLFGRGFLPRMVSGSSANRLSLLLGLALASIPGPLHGQNDWGVKVSDGNITLPVYFNDTGCTGKNLFKVTFIPAPGPLTNYQPLPWVTPPN